MSLVSRGLGLGAGALLVTAGLGLALTVVVPSQPMGDMGAGGPVHGYKVNQHKRVEVKLTAELRKALIGHVTARAGSKVALVSQENLYEVGHVGAYVGSKSKVLLVHPATKVGSIVAQGYEDVSEEEVIALLIGLLQDDT